MEDIIIRRAEKTEIPRIGELFREMLRTVSGTDNVQAYEEGYLDKFFGGEDIICAAEDRGTVVGYLSVEVHREDPDFLYLDDFSVTAEYRGRGIGTELLGKAESYAVTKGIHEIYLHAQKDNEKALRLYFRNGYVIAAEEGERVRLVKIL